VFLITEGWLDGFFSEYHYLAPFVILLLCGFGLPLPEEVTLIGSGLLLYQGKVDFVAISTTCGAAILLGDSIPYWLGRRYGERALRVRWVRRILHPERFALLEKRFAEHGNWAIFTCRFLPGIRIPGYFTAGTLKMSYGRFLLLDFLGVLISVPTSIYLGKLFGERMELLQEKIQDFHLVLGFAILSLILIMFVRGRIRAREQQVKGVEEQAAQSSAPEPPDGTNTP
jgi:membrane protein DedA with SNARE-associated domain